MRAQTDAVEQAVCVLDGFRRVFAEEAAPEADIAEPSGKNVFHNGQPLDQGVFLEDHADPPPGLAQTATAEPRDVHIAQGNLSGRRLDQPVDAPDQSGFTGSRRPDQADDLTGFDCKTNVGERPIACPIDF